MTDKIILASKSPRRKQLLRQIDFDFKVVPSKIEEDLSLKLKPFLFVEYYANLKAQNVANKYQNSWVIGADTIVVFNEKIFGKPKDKNESYSMLKELSGNTHNVFTGISIHHQKKGIKHTFHEKTIVEFKTLDNSSISYYINMFHLLAIDQIHLYHPNKYYCVLKDIILQVSFLFFFHQVRIYL